MSGGEKKKKAVSNSGFVNTPKLVILSKLFNMEDALFPLFCKWDYWVVVRTKPHSINSEHM